MRFRNWRALTVHVETLEEGIEQFLVEGLIEEVISLVKTGKEAVVYCCRGGGPFDGQLLAAKVYKPRSFRSFRNDAVYREGRVILNKRDARAFAKGTRHGREVGSALWINHEWETLRQLYAAGVSVPAPLAQSAGAILFEFVGDEEAAAPALKGCELTQAQAQHAYQQLLRDVGSMLHNYVVHGDLSAYNVLYWQDKPVIIDFPQAVDPRFNFNAYSLLQRDVENINRYFARYGVTEDTSTLVERLWQAYERPHNGYERP
jgi:RIO kinase 1